MRRSSSPSSPSEGEIIESGSETKATTSQTSVHNGTNVNRNTRTKHSASRSPAPRAVTRSPPPPPRRHRTRSRSRSRSPYRAPRGEKRTRDREDDYESERSGRSAAPPRRLDSRRDDRYYDQRGSRHHRRQRSYYDYDRNDNYSDSLRYGDDYDRRHEKRQRTRSRSPYYNSLRKQKRYSSDERESRYEDSSSRYTGSRKYEGRRSSTEQSVSERGTPPVVAQNKRQEAEIRGNQVQQVSSNTNSGSLDKSAKVNADTEQNGVAEQPPEPVDEASLIEERRKRREAIKAKYRGPASSLLAQALHAGTENKASPAAEDSSASTPDKMEIDSPKQSPPLKTSTSNSGVQTPTDFKISKDEDLANARAEPRDGIDKEEPSAADYDPTLDMREDKMRHDKRHFGDEVSSGAYDETKTSHHDVIVPGPAEQQKPPVQAKPSDQFDMFAEDDDDMFAEETNGPTKPAQTNGATVPNAPQPQELDMSMMDNWDDPEGYYNVMLGELINGRYHVQQNLGKGMFSSVVRATDSKTEKLVAIKIIRNNDTMRKAGAKEIDILQQLLAADPDDKKHVIRFERQFDHKGHLCMVFENLSMNLREVLKKFGRDVGLNLRAIRAYAQQMFLGLSLLRKCNILHADLKPDNLLVNENRNILKVCDLGSASSTLDNEITPYLVSRFYRAPEIILGVPYDYSIDVWSIGCTLFELYTGKILFTGRNNNQMLRSIMECRGKIPPKFLRRGSLTHLHFDDLLNFRSTEEDKVTGRIITRVMDFKKPTRDLKTRLMGKGSKGMDDKEQKEVALFVDLLDRCLNVNPEKRCTPLEALKHPFIARTKG